ncbi:sulfatase [Novipirellula artificiosorum]|uniref:Choline-sulfatase n=1 Tax=Novipirellula artificiosorum TaxID=2528016 RepID=A0A5C6DTP7_9BACT|nr:sulfatase [Novipirellula artificiosorum]TWU39574.1 Choline-sulfatase [Novipirellula artificiosorum]
MKTTCCYIALLIGLCSVFTITVRAAEAPPNVLFIAIDDLNDWPKFMGRYPDAITPNMDRLAARGQVFTNAHCSYPLCGPSRASLFTGLSIGSLGGYKGQKAFEDQKVAKLAESKGTWLLHSYFRDHDYKTMAVGKLLHEHVPKGSVAMSGGRGGWNKLPGGTKLNWPSKKTLTDWGAYPGNDEEMSDHQAASWAVERLERKRKEPFMLMVGFLRPHVPWHVPQKWLDLYPDPSKLTRPPFKPDDLKDVSDAARDLLNDGYPRTEWAMEEEQWQDMIHSYLACISFVDAQVGRVLDALDASPYADNTLVILWSDHGYHMGEKNTFQKHTVWERSSRTPMIIAGPGVTAGQRCDRVVSLLDIYPTLVDLCSLPANPKCEGRSLRPLIKNPSEAWPYPALINCREGHYAVQTESHRYIRYEDGSEELYDHGQDPNEWSNLVADPAHADRRAAMAKQLKELLLPK